MGAEPQVLAKALCSRSPVPTMTFVSPPGHQPIYNPPIPYVGPIYGGLRCGMSVYVQGILHHHKHRFHINLQCGEFPGSDVAIHINPRFEFWDKVVFNSFQGGCWEVEEIIHHMPFRKGETFEIIIFANIDGYQVNVNGSQFHVFQHRIPLDRVSALVIEGDVSIQMLNIIGGGQYNMQGYQGGMGGGYPVGVGGGYPVIAGGAPGYPAGYSEISLPIMSAQPIFSPGIPYSNLIPGGITPKRTIVIRGMVPFGANRFGISLLSSATRDVVFHLNPRVMEGIVVRNSFLGGFWGQEENDVSFCPFQQGQYFDISIRCGNERFKVYVNGEHLCNFYHRYQPFGYADTLEITGDVQISYIHL